MGFRVQGLGSKALGGIQDDFLGPEFGVQVQGLGFPACFVFENSRWNNRNIRYSYSKGGWMDELEIWSLLDLVGTRIKAQ